VLIYRIDNFDNLCVLCGKLKKIYAGKNSVYKCDDSYYLVLGREKFLSLDTIKLESLLQEYGQRLIHPIYYRGYLNEYGSLIVKDKAIETLSKHFK
jgi:adapter protein MecA 1/2